MTSREFNMSATDAEEDLPELDDETVVRYVCRLGTV
jgi:hypothetical protein